MQPPSKIRTHELSQKLIQSLDAEQIEVLRKTWIGLLERMEKTSLAGTPTSASPTGSPTEVNDKYDEKLQAPVRKEDLDKDADPNFASPIDQIGTRANTQ
jgi:hypothetical protein